MRRIRQTPRIEAERDLAELGGQLGDAAFVPKLASQLERYWSCALAPHWSHIAELQSFWMWYMLCEQNNSVPPVVR